MPASGEDSSLIDSVGLQNIEAFTPVLTQWSKMPKKHLILKQLRTKLQDSSFSLSKVLED